MSEIKWKTNVSYINNDILMYEDDKHIVTASYHQGSKSWSLKDIDNESCFILIEDIKFLFNSFNREYVKSFLEGFYRRWRRSNIETRN